MEGEAWGYWADGTNRNTEQAFHILGLDPEEDDGVLELLCELTERE